VKKRKGWDTIIEALAILKSKGIQKNLVFVTSSSPEEYQEAFDLVREHGLESQVYFLFKIANEEKHWLYQRTEATMTPSRYEGFGIPVFESWAYGKPVLGTDIPVYRDFLHDGETGLVCAMGDAQGLARNIERLEDAALRGRIVEGGHKMLERYSDTLIVDRFEALVNEIRSRPA
jgi:glycosyltransferase involved in cell wall biosynthesis